MKRMVKTKKKKGPLSEAASAFGKMGGRANFKKHGLDGPTGLRARGTAGAKARWAKKEARVK